MLKTLNDVIEFIEDHLEDDLKINEVAEYIGESDYHFRRIFLYITGIPLSEYIKKRKLSQANQDLVNGSSVTETAFKYAYHSIDGFSRAFKSWSGYLPSDVYKTHTLISFPKLSFYIDVRGGENMEVKIVDMPAFNIAGIKARVPMQFEGVNPAIENLAERITDEQKAEMHKLQNIPPKQIINVSYDADENFLKEEGGLTHVIGVLTTENDINPILDTVSVDAHSWAVFPNEGEFPSTMQNTMARTHSEWLPSSDYDIVDEPSFSFTIMDEEKADYAYSEIWLPVKKSHD
ncbi:AraC family transcriptional regulator [Salinicoccus albus]|uniref:AraC family transcriptional regulator n=1 Tax=Salinicoccus albus TaxID=418756 RepID=UPI00036CF137|nr:AraC family transcriptional regulator [Salinicoccus albus]